MEEQEKSVNWVIAMVVLLILAGGWCFAAAQYAHAEEGWGSGAGRGAWGAFLRNGISQLANFPAVISFTVKKRLWLMLLVAGLEGAALIGGFKMKQLERELANPRRRRKR